MDFLLIAFQVFSSDDNHVKLPRNFRALPFSTLVVEIILSHNKDLSKIIVACREPLLVGLERC